MLRLQDQGRHDKNTTKSTRKLRDSAQQSYCHDVVGTGRESPFFHADNEYALNAAETAESASAQGKFWELHDFLYEHQNIDPEVALGFAKKLGLDTQKFQHELSQHKYESRIKEDFNGGVRSGVNGTPTFYVNGFRHDAEATAKDLVKALEQHAPK